MTGGLIGSPVGKFLIKKYHLEPYNCADTEVSRNDTTGGTAKKESLQDILRVILVLAICVETGHLVNQYLFSEGVLLPGFLSSMFVGIIITNIADLFKWQFQSNEVDTFNELSLNLFLSMSLMSMHLWVLSGAALPVMVALLAQMLIITLFTTFTVFRVMGKDYDAAIISSGFVGLGLGATPVAIANISALTSRFGNSLKALLVIPMVGAFFIDIMNAIAIKFFIQFF